METDVKILCTEPIPQQNPFIEEWYDAIHKRAPGLGFTWGAGNFWYGRREDYDILHIHWPDRLMESREVNAENIGMLADRLRYWSDRCGIVANIHNLTPHVRHTNDLAVRQAIYSSVDDFIHFGKAGKQLFLEQYGNILKEDCGHHVIPHGIYQSYHDDITRAKARDELGIPQDSVVMLSFGKLRHPEEKKLVKYAFRQIRNPDKHLLCGGWVYDFTSYKEKLLFHRHRLGGKFSRKYHISGRLTNREAATWFSVADIFFSPRIYNLNSGAVLMAFSFGKVIVGPNVGVIGELLTETGNPVYDAKNPASIADAMKQAVTLLGRDRGRENYDYALSHWNWENLASGYLKVYANVLSTY